MLPPGSRTNPAHSSENPSPSLPPSHQPISVSKHKCLSRHSSTRKSLWSPGTDNASKQPPSSQLPPPPPPFFWGGKEIKAAKEKTVGLPLARNNNTGNDLQEVSAPSKPSRAAPRTAERNCCRGCKKIAVFSLANICKTAFKQPCRLKRNYFALPQSSSSVCARGQ